MDFAFFNALGLGSGLSLRGLDFGLGLDNRFITYLLFYINYFTVFTVLSVVGGTAEVSLEFVDLKMCIAEI